MGLPFGLTRHILFLIIQSIVFLFVLIATPLDVLRSPRSNACYTMWGYQSNCRHSNTRNRCSSSTMEAAAAFSIISILLSAATIILSVLVLLSRVRFMPMITFILSCILVLTILIVWACIATIHNRGMCGGVFPDILVNHYDYGAGFGLLVTSWVLQIIATVVAVFMIC